jgi:hypothetical protein
MIAAQHRASTLVAVLVGLSSLLGASAASAQGRCPMDRLAGTYAFESHGSITSVSGLVPPIDWALVSRPFIFVGWFTVQAGGSMNGEGWVILGRISSGLTARPFDGQLTELDESTCTAVLEWTGSPAPGAPAGFHRERLVFVENAREFRSILMQSPSGTMAWTGRGHRITPAAESVDTSGPHLLKGDVLLQCETLSSVVGSSASAASLSTLTVAGDGGFWGTSFVKNPTYSEQSVEGVFEVQPSGKVEAWLTSPSTPGVIQHGRGMLFDGGRHGFLIMPLETTQPDSSIVRPAFARCELLSLGR